MAFATRVFCRQPAAPSISELLLWLHQHETPAVVVGGASRGDLMSSFWSELLLSYEPEEEPLRVLVCRADDDGAGRLREEVADFLEDLGELPPGPARELVEQQLRATRMLVIVEFPPDGIVSKGYEMNGWMMELFLERAEGMVQADGIGFFDEDDEVILRLG